MQRNSEPERHAESETKKSFEQTWEENRKQREAELKLVMLDYNSKKNAYPNVVLKYEKDKKV